MEKEERLIPSSEIEFTFVRSSGPGGQNVNKVNSKAVLRWNLLKSPTLYEDTRARLLEKLGSKLTRDGEVLISSDVYRDQLRNKEDCLDKLDRLIRNALHVDKKRKKSKPSYSSVKKAEVKKKKHSEKKKNRKFSYDD